MTPGRSKREGSSLLESLVASAIILLVLLSLIGTLAYGLEGTRNAEGHQQAVYHARRLFELIRERRLAERETVPPEIGFSDASTYRVPLADPPFENDFPTDTGYTRQLVTTRLSSDPTHYQSRLYQVEVTVFWDVEGRENSFKVTGIYRAAY